MAAWDKSNPMMELLEEVGPLLFAAIIMAFFFGWPRVRESYKQHTRLAWFIQYCISSIIVAFLAVATTFLIPLVLPGELSYEVKVGITVYICVFGIKGLDGVARKRFGFSIVDLHNPEDLHKMKERMTCEQQRNHYEICPFKGDCNQCCQDDVCKQQKL